MKKRLLTMMLVLTIVLSLAPSVFATGEQGNGTISSSLINLNDPEETFFSAEITGLNATDSVEIKMYSDETLIGTTTLAKKEYLTNGTLTVKICTTGDSSSWTTVWEESHPRADYVPTSMVLYVDREKMNTADVPMTRTGDETAVNWTEVPGVNVASIGNTYYTSLKAAVEKAADGATIKVLADVALTEPLIINKNVTITADSDVTITSNATDVFTVGSGGTLTLGEKLTINSNTSVLYANGGTINIDGAKISVSGAAYNAAFAGNNGTINVKSGSISQSDDKVTLSAENATVNVSGGTVHSENNSAIAALANATANITGGTVSTNATAMKAAAYAQNGGKVIVDGGTVESKNEAATSFALVAGNSGAVEVKSGTVTGTKGAVLAHENTNASAVISGGTINGAVSTDEDAVMTVSGGAFTDLAGAVEYATDGAAIKVAGNVALTEVITVSKNVTITADSDVTITSNATDVFTVGSGGTLTLGEKLTINSNTSVLYANGGTINIEGAKISVSGAAYNAAFAGNNGTINVKSGSISQSDDKVTLSAENATVNVIGGTVHSENNSAIAALANATANITGGTVSTNATAMKAAAYAQNGGKVIVDGGTVESKNEAATSFALVAGSSGAVEVKSGTVTGTKGAVLAHENTNASAAISGGTINGAVSTDEDAVMTISGGAFTAQPNEDYLANGFEVKDNGDGTYGVQEKVYPETVSFWGENLELGNTLNMAFFFAKDQRADWTGYTAKVTMNGTTTEYALDQWKTDNTGDYYYIYFTGIYAKMMTDEITVVICDSQGNTVSETFTTSIKEYGTELMTKEPAKRDMVVALLNYGAEAQKIFAYNTDKMANADLT